MVWPDEWPWDGDVGKAVFEVFGGVGGVPCFFAVRSCVSDVWFGVSSAVRDLMGMWLGGY